MDGMKPFHVLINQSARRTVEVDYTLAGSAGTLPFLWQGELGAEADRLNTNGEGWQCVKKV